MSHVSHLGTEEFAKYSFCVSHSRSRSFGVQRVLQHSAMSRQQMLQLDLEYAGLREIYTNLSKHSIKEAGHVMELGMVDLMQLGVASQQQAERVLRIAAARLAPRCVPLIHQLEKERMPRIQFGIPDIDSALGGGLLNASITELVGPAGQILHLFRNESGASPYLELSLYAGVGKSQMCMSLAARACLPSGCAS